MKRFVYVSGILAFVDLAFARATAHQTSLMITGLIMLVSALIAGCGMIVYRSRAKPVELTLVALLILAESWGCLLIVTKRTNIITQSREGGRTQTLGQMY